jgi:hypothetical protein
MFSSFSEFQKWRGSKYLGVPVDVIVLPVIHTAWGNAWCFVNRLRIEERLVEAVPVYPAAMSGKPRFLPKIF